MNSRAFDGAGMVAGNWQMIAVWDLPTRVFHWSLVLSFAGAYITGEVERWGTLHALLGYVLLLLIGFRLVWGVIGSRYARFSAFVTAPVAVLRYLGSLLGGRPEHHVGHNPAGAMAIVLLLALGLMVAVTGLATLKGIGGEWVEDIHEAAAQAMLAVVAIHVAGVLVSSVLHRENLVRAMLTGRKHGHPAEGLASMHRLLGIALLLGLVALGAVWATGSTARLPGLGDVEQLDREWQEEGRGEARERDGEDDGRRRGRGRGERDDD
ncbi:MAG TPA: cytochrome b/b6 domain-containing protein [Rhodocyclaceae bacterium]